jgi:N utilization substance protein B
MVGPEQPDDITCAVDQQDTPFEYSTLSRREQRGLILHMLYAMDSFDYQASLTSLVDNFNRGFDLNIPLDGEMVVTAQAIIDARMQLDEEVLPFLANWRLERVGLFTKLILRLALWELKQQQTPATVVINEAIELSKCFAEHEAYRFVNGILDEYSKAQVPSMRGKKEPA